MTNVDCLKGLKNFLRPLYDTLIKRCDYGHSFSNVWD